MRLSRSIPFALLITACAGGAPVPSPAPVAVPTYAPLLALARAQDTTLIFRDLRLAYTGTSDYSPYGTRDVNFRRAMYAAADSSAFDVAMKWVDSILATNYVDIEAHGFATFATARLGDSAQSGYHRWMTRGLLASIDGSGDGSRVRPYEVISVAEEYAWARFRGFMRKGIQGLGECKGRPCDSIEFTDRRTQRDTTLYFDVSIPQRAFARTLRP